MSSSTEKGKQVVTADNASKTSDAVSTYHNPDNTMALLKDNEAKVGDKVLKVPKDKVNVKSFKDIFDNITTDDIRALVQTMEAISSAEVRALAGNLFDFNGYDPIVTIKVLIAANRYYREVAKLADETPDTLKEDIMLAVACHVQLGNLQTKAVSRRSKEGRAVIAYLIHKYSIYVGSTGAGLPSEDLTFPRIAGAFPVLTIRTVIAYPRPNNQYNHSSANRLPNPARVQAFASLLHSSMEETTRGLLLRCVCAFSCDYSITVHEGQIKKLKLKRADHILTFEDAWNTQWPFFEIVSESVVPEVPMKRAMIAELGVANWYTELEIINSEINKLLPETYVAPDITHFKASIAKFIGGVTTHAITSGGST